MHQLQSIYLELLQSYPIDEKSTLPLWQEIESNYSNPKRPYHNLSHLQDLLEQLSPLQSGIKNWPCLLFSLFYHDIIYYASKSNNEEKSADLAVLRMQQIGATPAEIEQSKTQIIATKTHFNSDDLDTNYFTDADLSILGRDWDRYYSYYQAIRKEYAIYPNFMYRKGRKKVIQHFLKMEKIFKTEYFFNKYENQARENLIKEIELI